MHLFILTGYIIQGRQIPSIMSEGLIRVEPSKLSGKIRLPPSKSHALRWLILASMDFDSSTEIQMHEIGDDVQTMIDGLTKLGISIKNSTVVGGPLYSPGDVLDARNSGTALRFLMAQVAFAGIHCRFDGDNSLRARPHEKFLTSLGSPNTSLPFQVHPLKNKEKIIIDIGETSQFISASMLATPRLNQPIEIESISVGVSNKHAELTWHLCKETGAKVPGLPWDVRCPERVEIPADASMASFPKILDLSISNMPASIDSIGHDISENENGIYDLTNANDLISPLSAKLCLTHGGTITGASHAMFKESNRIEKTVELLQNFSLECQMTSDGLKMPGGQFPMRPNRIIETHGDHRLQMTAVALGCLSGAVIRGAKTHHIAWPSYLQQLENCGASIIHDGQNDDLASV